MTASKNYVDPALCLYVGAHVICTIDNVDLNKEVPRGNGLFVVLLVWNWKTIVIHTDGKISTTKRFGLSMLLTLSQLSSNTTHNHQVFNSWKRKYLTQSINWILWIWPVTKRRLQDNLSPTCRNLYGWWRPNIDSHLVPTTIRQQCK